MPLCGVEQVNFPDRGHLGTGDRTWVPSSSSASQLQSLLQSSWVPLASAQGGLCLWPPEPLGLVPSGWRGVPMRTKRRRSQLWAGWGLFSVTPSSALPSSRARISLSPTKQSRLWSGPWRPLFCRGGVENSGHHALYDLLEGHSASRRYKGKG